MLTLAAAGQPPTTTELRRIQLVRIARDIGGHPADVPGRSSSKSSGGRPDGRSKRADSYHAGIRRLSGGGADQAGARPSADGCPRYASNVATRAPRPEPTAYQAICLTSGMSSASTGIICSVRSVCALHTTHCRPNVTFELACQGTTYGSNQSKSSESSDRIFQAEVPVLVEVRDPGR